MPSFAPQTVDVELVAEFRTILLSRGSYLSKEDPQWLRLHSLCEKLQRVDVLAASNRKAELFYFAGDLEQAEYWAANLARNGDRVGSAIAKVIVRTNSGAASSAASLLNEILDVRNGQINRSLLFAFACGGFSEIVSAVQSLERAGGTADRGDIVMKAEAAKTALSKLGVSESSFRLIMDEAGNLLKANSLIWLNESPDLATSVPSERPVVSLHYRVQVTPQKAAEMTWELAEVLATKDLIFPDVSVGYRGQSQ